MGMAYGLMAGSSANSIVYLTPRKFTGMALGLMAFSINVGLIATPLLMGQLKDHASDLELGYYWVTRLSTLLSIVGLAISVVIHYHDIHLNRGILSMSVFERNELLNKPHNE